MNKKLQTDYLFNALMQISNIIVPLITTPYISRVLGATKIGDYSFAYFVAHYCTMFVKMGLNNYGNRTIAYARDDEDVLSRTFWGIYLFQAFMGIIVSLLYFGYVILWAPNKSLGIIMFIYVLSSAIDITWCLYGLEEFKTAAIRDFMIKILTAVCIFIFVKSGDDVGKYALIFSLGMLAGQLVAILAVVPRIKMTYVGGEEIARHIKPNMILFVPVIAVSIYKVMDKIMLGIMSNSTELGYYHSTENVIRVPMALINALGTVMLPRVSNLISREEEETISDLFVKSIALAMFISNSISFGIMTVAQEFVPIFYGKGFEKCIFLFYIILPSCIFLAFANVIRTQYLIPRKKDRSYIISLTMGAIINVFFNLALIPGYGAIGAALGTLAAEVVVCVVQAAFVYKEVNIGRNIVNSLPFVIAGIIMFLVCRNFVPPIGNAIIALLVKILISGALYLSVLGVFVIVKRKLVNAKPS